MNRFLQAHADFVDWLDRVADAHPSASDVEEALLVLARFAAGRGMTGSYWAFVIDGLIVHAKRRHPDNIDLPGHLARGFNFANHWKLLGGSEAQPKRA